MVKACKKASGRRLWLLWLFVYESVSPLLCLSFTSTALQCGFRCLPLKTEWYWERKKTKRERRRCWETELRQRERERNRTDSACLSAGGEVETVAAGLGSVSSVSFIFKSPSPAWQGYQYKQDCQRFGGKYNWWGWNKAGVITHTHCNHYSVCSRLCLYGDKKACISVCVSVHE